MDVMTAMKLAIEEGKKGAGFVSPNPLVGCVILDKNGDLLAHGYHAKVGEAHAEINALNAVKDQSRLEGAHVIVTLEPCAHQGRTGPCAVKLASLPIASVTYGLDDPNPLVAGKGAQILRDAGKQVARFQNLQTELEELVEIFFMNMISKRPFVALKVASSLDGKVALRDGTSQWITGPDAREHVHELRGQYDAVLSGVGTFLRDSPRLNSRLPRYSSKPQNVVLLDPEGRSYPHLANSELAKVRSSEAIRIVTAPGVSAPPIGRQIKAPDRERDFDLRAVLELLYGEGIRSVFVEAGPATASAFLRAKLVDRVYLFMAPKLIGDGLSWTTQFEVGQLDRAIPLDHSRVEMHGSDFLITGKPRWS